MLRFLFFVCLFFYSAMLIGQAPWAPIHPDKVYTYEYCDTIVPYHIGTTPDNLPSDSIYCIQNVIVDSQMVVNSDTIFLLRNRAYPFDSVVYNNGNHSGYANLWDFQHPSIMGYTIRKTPQGEYYFEGMDTVLLKPMEGLGANWTYTANITATVTQIFADTLFNQPDSIKVIQLSNGDSVLISRAYGVLEMTALDITDKKVNLLGLQKDQVTWGQRSPDFWDFFDFQVGDVFYYEGERQCVLCTTLFCKAKIEITNKVTLPEGYLYEYTRVSSSLEPTCNNLFWDNDTLLILKDSIIPGFDFNHIYKEYVDLGNFNYGVALSPNQGGFGNTVGEYLSFYHSTDTNGLGKLTMVSLYQLGDSFFDANMNNGTEHYYYQPTLGMTNYELSGFEHSFRLTLMGYVRNGDTTGIVLSDSAILTNIENVENTSEIDHLQARIAPNPSSDHAQLLLAAQRPTPLQVELFSLQGERLRRFTLPPGSTTLLLSAEGLANGLYFLRLRGEQVQHTLKWRVQR